MQTGTLLHGTSTGTAAQGFALILLLAAGGPPACAADPGPTVGGYRLSGPYTHDNLTVFLLHGTDRLPGRIPLTLQQALDQQKIVVHEKGAVNELVIENVSDDEVFIQSGDIVKGGQQDRLIASDLIVPPHSGKLTVMCFCVEQGRWQQRGKEAVARFSSSTLQLPSRGLKWAGGQLGQFGNQGGQIGWQAGQFYSPVASLGGRLQLPGRPALGPLSNGTPPPIVIGGQVSLGNWATPGGQLGGLGSQFGLGAGFGGGFGGSFAGGGFGGQLGLTGQFGNLGGGLGTASLTRFGQLGNLGGQQGMQGGVWQEVASFQAKLARNVGVDVRSQTSRSSLQLTLESDRVRQAVEKYLVPLASLADRHKDAVGYVFAINGQINGGDVYAQAAFFRKLWPKLLQANAVEALAERRTKPFRPITPADVAAFLERAERGEEVTTVVTTRTTLVARETDLALFVETRDQGRQGAWLHRSYLAKDQPEVVSFRALIGQEQ
jgi:hypothetical protein